MGLAGGLATNGQSGGGGASAPAIAFGTAAARPAAAAGNSGTAYYATDTGELTVSNGAAWSSLLSTSATTFSLASASSQFKIGNGAAIVGGVAPTIIQFPQHVDVTGAGNGLRVAEGSNAKQGTATLVAGSVVVANTSVTATSRIFLTSQADGGTPGFLRVSARTAGTSFTITSSSGTDTSVVAYEIFEVG